MNNRRLILATELSNVQYAGKTYEEIAEILNTKPLIQNPQPRNDNVPQVPALETIIPLVSPERRSSIAETQTYERILHAAAAGRIDWIKGNISTLLHGGYIVQSEYNEIIAELDKVGSDPDYQEQIPGKSRAEELGIGFVSLRDIQGALNQ